MVGLPALSRPVVSASLHTQCTKRNRGFTDEGRVGSADPIRMAGSINKGCGAGLSTCISTTG